MKRIKQSNNQTIKQFFLSALCAVCAAVPAFATWTVGYDEDAAKCYLEDSATGWKLWIKTNTKTKAPDCVTVGGVTGYEIERRYSNDNTNAIERISDDGALDLSQVATDTQAMSGGGYPVVSLARNAFAKSPVTSVTAPDCRSIGVITFQNCTSLTNVTVSSDVSQIAAESTWSGCKKLVTFSPTYCPKVTTMANKGAFNGCTALTGDWWFPNLTTLSSQSFFGNCAITSVRMDVVTSVEQSFCGGCTSLTNAYLPKAQSLGGSAFWSCSKLKSVTIGGNIGTFYSSTFNGCHALEQLEPRSFTNATVIQVNAFHTCKSLRGKLSFPRVTEVAGEAFNNTTLDELYLPKLASTSANTAFGGMVNLSNIVIGGVGTAGRANTFKNANTNGDKILHLYWKGADIPTALNDSWLGNAYRARIYCRGSAMRAWLAQLKTLAGASPNSNFREKADFANDKYKDNEKSDYPGDIARAIFVGYNSCNFWLCDWDYEGDTYNTTIECPENVGLGDVFVNGELILPRSGVYKVPQDCTLTITYEALNGKLFEDGTGTYVKEGIAAAETIPASMCDKKLMEAAKRQLTLSLADLAAKNIAEVALVCAKDFTCTTNDNVVTWEVMDSVPFDLVYTCAGVFRFTGRAKTLTETYADGISENSSVDLTKVETPQPCDPLWEVVYNKDEKQAYLVNDILGWKIYLKTDGNKGTYRYTENGVTGYVIFRDYSWQTTCVSANESWELDLTNVKRDTGYPVVFLDYGAFVNTSLKRLVAPECQRVGTVALYGCSQLTDVEISPDANSIFNESTFNGCTSLTNFYPTVFSNVVTITKYGFAGAPVGGDWEFPNLRSSTGAVFDGCKNPNGFTVSLPKCTSMADGFFRNSTVTRFSAPLLEVLPNEMAKDCSRLVEVTLTNAIRVIGKKAFSGCTKLPGFGFDVFPATTNVEWYAFNSCKLLEGTLEFPLVPSFPDSDFSGCEKLTSVVAPKALIGQYSFSGCTSLKTATIGGYGSSANGNFFTQCTNLTDIYVTDAYPAPAKKVVAMFSWGSDLKAGETRMDPPVVHVRVADDADYSAWEALCSYTKDNLPESCKKVENYASVRKKLGFVGNAPELDKTTGEITRIQNSAQNIAWIVRWPQKTSTMILVR